MQIDIRADVKELTKSLNRIQRKQIPFATSKALNNVAFDVRKSLQDGLDIHLDRPTPYTKRGVQVEKSTKKDLKAEVGFRSNTFGKGQGVTTQASYMKRQIEGGLRTPKTRSIPVPIEDNIRLNKFGSLTRNKVRNLLADKDKYFSGKLKGAKGKGTGEGIFERMPANSKRKSKKRSRSGKVRMVISWNPNTKYKARFPFKKIVERTVRFNFRKRFDFELREALKTAR
jgi:hypothetical protein